MVFFQTSFDTCHEIRALLGRSQKYGGGLWSKYNFSSLFDALDGMALRFVAMT